MSRMLMALPLFTYWIQRTHKSLSKLSMTMHSSCSCHIKPMLQDVVRIDVVWDTYMEDSLKAQTQMNRGSGNHLRRVSNSTNIPVDWKRFLRCDANKDSLFHLLADAIREFHPPQRKKVISTYGRNAVSSAIADLSDMFYTHEEADTRLLFHASQFMYLPS